MRRVSKVAVVAVTGALALTATACGSKPKDESKSTPSASQGAGGGGGTAAKVKACMVTDTGGIDDRSFNASAWNGLQQAQKQLGAEVKYVTSKSENDYVPNLDSLAKENCTVIVAVGGLMADATTQAAKANPNQKYVIVDSTSVGDNIKGLQYNTAQGGFLGGYLAAAQTQTGKVATFGGKKIPPVTIYMDGFVEGVKYYNQQKGKNVQVLGWDEAKQDGSMAEKFDSPADGERIANDFIAQGADVIHPVAGQTGLGAASAASKSNGKASILWVDVDGYESASNYKSVMLSTVTKAISDSVFQSVKETSEGKYSTTPYLGTLQNNGTGLAPYHDFDSKVSAETKNEINQLKQDIISGKIQITSPAQPKS
ncbi:BMP family lipoprotein [Yinghuangia seranimata]|uniref:BMP family lipoprotein n=1 Tax=Yinghuangia seranimata TaxID=408067 RepID=UPI00248B3D73|nr:BMP family ABC transporter substrate-binding protein [Yinghuangia seranimata]MDI2130946.1 BMP family ABC transporter substrate-binding protein [Yinghuangia seranimata]